MFLIIVDLHYAHKLMHYNAVILREYVMISKGNLMYEFIEKLKFS